MKVSSHAAVATAVAVNRLVILFDCWVLLFYFYAFDTHDHCHYHDCWWHTTNSMHVRYQWKCFPSSHGMAANSSEDYTNSFLDFIFYFILLVFCLLLSICWFWRQMVKFMFIFSILFFFCLRHGFGFEPLTIAQFLSFVRIFVGGSQWDIIDIEELFKYYFISLLYSI